MQLAPLHTFPVEQLVPPQHGWPAPPHWQLLFWQVRFELLQALPVQHASPCAPHTTQSAPLHTLPVEQLAPPQQAWPVLPHWQVPPWQVRFELPHALPEQQAPHWPQVPLLHS
jgi:hypothetical protein